MAGAARSLLGIFTTRRKPAPTSDSLGSNLLPDGAFGLKKAQPIPPEAMLPNAATGRAGQRRLGDYDTDAVMQEDAIETAARKAGRRARRFVGNGRTQTILTGMDGVAGSAPTVRRTLLGL